MVDDQKGLRDDAPPGAASGADWHNLTPCMRALLRGEQAAMNATVLRALALRGHTDVLGNLTPRGRRMLCWAAAQGLAPRGAADGDDHRHRRATYLQQAATARR